MKKRRFTDRVWLERIVLTAVNTTNVASVPLTGLSQTAIELWRAQNGIPDDSQVVAQISEISRKCDLLVDCSRDVFDEDEIGLTRPLKLQVQSLQDELGRAKS
jgi:hypothetical protein